MKLLLQGLTKKGKARVKQHGSEWQVVQERRTVLFSEGSDWLDIESEKTGERRWIKALSDKDFKVNDR